MWPRVFRPASDVAAGLQTRLREGAMQDPMLSRQ